QARVGFALERRPRVLRALALVVRDTGSRRGSPLRAAASHGVQPLETVIADSLPRAPVRDFALIDEPALSEVERELRARTGVLVEPRKGVLDAAALPDVVNRSEMSANGTSTAVRDPMFITF